MASQLVALELQISKCRPRVFLRKVLEKFFWMTFLADSEKKRAEFLLPHSLFFLLRGLLRKMASARRLIEASLHRRAGKYPLAIRSTNELQLFPS